MTADSDGRARCGARVRKRCAQEARVERGRTTVYSRDEALTVSDITVAVSFVDRVSGPNTANKTSAQGTM